ncbi:hypothetical protein LX73_1882 [Fodinibius salinus]|uniref:Zinc-finger n=1 Tax=Fodinibius salinus TaxID=860790 RepID=A0A5D3YG46_9BACT|nr:hypothetical protein [Fodinibius salinus]TYP92522.1 hypothetical protein LX73_1882 [Fodinibius salinus]
MKLTTNITKKILGAVAATADEEIACGKCYEQVEKFVELKLSGKSPEEAMPLVEEHLQRCEECREEYEVLLNALQELE